MCKYLLSIHKVTEDKQQNELEFSRYLESTRVVRIVCVISVQKINLMFFTLSSSREKRMRFSLKT